MTLELRKFQLIEMIMAIKDERLLANFEEMARNQRVLNYEAGLKPMSKQELEQRALASENDIKEGRFTTAEELEKEMKNW
ncbi:MAG: hypothetical protein IT258_13515 [Saprospiraceae bacterium]|nr:hypothetical protein [Saprospiraceae bacterium]